MKAPAWVCYALLASWSSVLGRAASFGSLGVVDLRNANYSQTVYDLKWEKGKAKLVVDRTYNSRSLFDGIFGFGWCSSFETTLKLEDEGTIRVTMCGDGEEYRFLAADTSRPRAAREWTDLIHGTVRYRDGRFIVTDKKGKITEFGEDGRILSENSPGEGRLDFAYENGLLRRVQSSDGRWLAFHYSSNGKLKEIRTSDQRSIRYQTGIGGDLLAVTGGELSSCQYVYNNLHNLIRWSQSGKEAELTYNDDKDWVVGFKEHGGCEEQYAYVAEPRTLDRYSTYVKRICGGQLVHDVQMQFWYVRMQFWYRYRQAGREQYLYRNVLTTHTFLGTDVVEEVSHPVFPGLLESRTVNGVRTSFVYDAKGKLSKTVTAGGPEPVGKDLQNCSVCGSVHDPVTGETGEPGEH